MTPYDSIILFSMLFGSVVYLAVLNVEKKIIQKDICEFCSEEKPREFEL